VDETFQRELREFLAIPSVSADPAHREDVKRAGQWVCDFINRIGGEAELTPFGEKELAIGDIKASHDPENAPTVLVYGHFDVQPPAPLELWESEPFDLTLRGEWAYARGIADDKGQLYILLKAAQRLVEANALPVNLRFVCDGEEEIGGHTIVDWLAVDDVPTDAAIIFDGGMVKRDVPVFDLGTRGLIAFDVKVKTGDRDLHSGMYGGSALNAMHALTQILASVIATDGRVAEPLRAGIVAPTEEELSGWATLPEGSGELSTQGARPMDARAADEFYVRTWAETTVEVNGIEGGSPVLQKTVLPVFAQANVSLRLAPGQDPKEIAPVFERLVREAAPEGADVTVELWSDSEPGLIPPDAAAIKLGQDAFERVLGVRPLLVRSGGTLPIVPALAKKGVPTIITGFALAESNVHSPNERLLVEYVPKGIETARALYTELAKLG
jgi:acetylornithine deacetylase/succinyl-diaminopimelate desuccinylase-like protein